MAPDTPTGHLYRPSRRQLLAAGGALGLGALLSACGGDNGSSGGGSGSWSFRDDRGKTVTTDGTPKNLVAFVGTAAVLHDYGITCKGVFGPTKQKNGKPDAQAGDLDVDRVTILGNTWGEFNVEKYASLNPDLLITSMYLKNTLWYVPDESKDEILRLAPSIGLQVADVSLPEPLRRHAELAEALGADMSAPKVVQAKERFDKAVEDLRRAAEEADGLKVMAASGDPDLFYVSTPKRSADLRYYRELGVDFVIPKKVDSQGFFQSLSWENAGMYHADLIMLDNRTGALTPEDLQAKPTWRKLPAVQAGQVIPWHAEPRFSYAGCAPLLEQLAQAIRKAKKLD